MIIYMAWTMIFTHILVLGITIAKLGEPKTGTHTGADLFISGVFIILWALSIYYYY